MVHVDTHVLVDLYLGRTRLFPRRALRLLEENDIRVSPMVLLELRCLYELSRIKRTGHEMLADLRNRIGAEVSDASFAHIATCAETQSWTRDPFDRVIVGNALAENTKLLTRDPDMLEHVRFAVWD